MRTLLSLIACTLIAFPAFAIEPLVGPGNTGKKDGKEITNSGAGPHRTFSERSKSGKVGRDRENEGKPVIGPHADKAAEKAGEASRPSAAPLRKEELR